jgi:hypothetical protein
VELRLLNAIILVRVGADMIGMAFMQRIVLVDPTVSVTVHYVAPETQWVWLMWQ